MIYSIKIITKNTDIKIHNFETTRERRESRIIKLHQSKPSLESRGKKQQRKKHLNANTK